MQGMVTTSVLGELIFFSAYFFFWVVKLRKNQARNQIGSLGSGIALNIYIICMYIYIILYIYMYEPRSKYPKTNLVG